MFRLEALDSHCKAWSKECEPDLGAPPHLPSMVFFLRTTAGRSSGCHRRRVTAAHLDIWVGAGFARAFLRDGGITFTVHLNLDPGVVVETRALLERIKTAVVEGGKTSVLAHHDTNRLDARELFFARRQVVNHFVYPITIAERRGDAVLAEVQITEARDDRHSGGSGGCCDCGCCSYHSTRSRKQ